MSRVLLRVLILGTAALLSSTPARSQDPAAAEVALSRGIQAFMADDYPAARGQFEAAIAHDREFAAGHYFLGLTFLQLASRATGAERDALLEQAATEFEESRLRDPALVLAYLDGGITAALLGRFEQAESSFKTFIQERPDDPLPRLFLAVLYYRRARDEPAELPRATENLADAEAAFARSGKANPELEAYIKLYRALVHLQQNQLDEARSAATEGARLAPDTPAAARNEALLAQLEHGQAATRRPWDLTLRLGYDYDTNVVLRGRNIRHYYDDADHDWRFGLGHDFTYRLFENDEWVLGFGTTSFNSWHSDIHQFNVQSYGANIYTGYSPKAADWLTFGLRYDWDYSFVGNDDFLQRHRITPQIEITEATWTRSLLYYQFEDRQYYPWVHDPRLERSGDTHALGFVQSFDVFKLFDRFVTASTSYRFENMSTDGSQFAGDGHIFGLGVGVPLPWNMTFDFNTEWEHDVYRYGSVFDRNHDPRVDWINTLVFGITKKFDEHASLRFQAELTDSDSNVHGFRDRSAFDYNRVIYGVTLIYRF